MNNEVKFYPLTHPQQGIWYTEKMYPGTSIGNVVGTVRIKGEADCLLLEKAINILLEKNDSIRMRISVQGGEPRQYISEYRYISFDFFNFSENGVQEMYRWEEKETRKPFSLTDSDLFYFAILKVGDLDYRFYIKTHHLVSDAWTMNAIVNQVMSNYTKLVKGESIEEEKKPSYVEYIVKEQNYKDSKKFSKDKEFWNDVFEDVPEISTLKTHDANLKTTAAKRKPFLIPASLASKISEYCDNNKISIFTFFLSILAIYINRIALKEDIVIGTPVLNRSNHREKKMLGMFISTIPIRIKIDDSLDLTSFIKKVSKEWMVFLRHHEYPHELLMKDIRSRYKGIKNLYDIVLSYQNARLTKDDCVHNFEGRWHFNGHQKDSLYIHINDREGDGNLIVDYDYLTQFFSLKAIEYIHKHMLVILQDAMKNPQKKIYELEVLEEEEKKRILYEFNNTKADYPKDKTVHQLFEEQVERTPNSIALVFEDKQLTYTQLNEKSNKLARKLREKGVGRDTIVGIMANRSLEMVVGIIAILKAGGAFLPIDPQYPEERVKYMLSDSETTVLLTQKKLETQVEFNGEIIDIMNESTYKGGSLNIANINRPQDLAYIIFTSGSSGKPKGVLIEHRSVNNFIQGVTGIMDFSAKSTVLSVTTMSFDIFIFEMLPSLLNGAKVVIANESQKKIPQLLCELIIENGINKILATPSQMQLLIARDSNSRCLENVKEIMLGGEVFPKPLLKKLKTLTNAKIYNGYGPTEITIGATFKDLTEENEVNIGKPITNTDIYILDNHLNPVPIGIVGEIYIGGDGLARGYLKDIKLTQKKFIQSPFKHKKRIYKTGDMARWFPKGDIEFVGRTDYQVKIRGLRIELGEIENQLTNINGVTNAVVVANDGKGENKYLCAYFATNKEISVADIRRHLLKKLPDYMVPSYFVKIDELPYTPNGKIDIKRLPQLDISNIVEPDYVGPRNEIEEKLVKEWEEVLGLQKVGIDNNFFELGGDSLSAIKLQVKLLKYNLTMKMQDLYIYSTIRELSERIISLEEVSAAKEMESADLVPTQKHNDAETINIERQKVNCKDVLLIGTTGFLGMHILDYLLNNTDTNIYCMVRGKDINNAKYRLRELLKFYFSNKYNDIIDKRLFVVKGDITSEKLELEEEEYSEIGKKIEAIIHTAATVKYYGEYSEFEKINVFGTENIVKFAIKFNKPLYYISTMGVSGQYLVSQKNEGAVFTENDLYIGQNYLENVYVRSKFEAECLINKYVDVGLKAAILRVGNLTGRYSDGHFQKNIEENSFYNIIKSLIEIGSVSNSIVSGQLELTPVDLCSKAVVELLMTGEAIGKVFHLYNNNVLEGLDLLNMFSEIGIDIKLLDKESFNALVLNVSSDDLNSRKLSGIVSFLQEENQLSFDLNVKLSSDITQNYLKRIGFQWPKIDINYLNKLIRYMEKEKFLDVFGTCQKGGNL